MEITIFGKGNMGKAIGGNFEKAGQKVTYGGRDFKGALGDMVVLAVPYGAVDSILSAHKEELAGKVVVDITNPVNFDTFDGLVVPADSSAAAEIQKRCRKHWWSRPSIPPSPACSRQERWERRNRRWYWQLLTLQMLKETGPGPGRKRTFRYGCRLPEAGS